MFANRQGARQTKDNISRRLKTAIKRANPKLANAGIEPLSLEKVTPYSFRRTYASLRAALRDDPVYAAEQMGHTDPAFTFRTYAKAVRRRGRLSGAHLEAFDRALEWARIGPAESAEIGRNADLGAEEVSNPASESQERH